MRAILGLSLGVTLWASTAQAQPADKRTFFTFSAPIALPGATLPAGRYIFRIVDTTSSRKVIQVLSDDGNTPAVTEPPQVAQNNQRDQFPAERTRTARNELPKTASTLPFVGLIGMISALGFVTARFGTSLKF